MSLCMLQDSVTSTVTLVPTSFGVQMEGCTGTRGVAKRNIAESNTQTVKNQC